MGLIPGIIVASLAASAGTSIYSAVESSQSNKKAAKSIDDQKNQQNKLLADANAKLESDKSNTDNIAARDKARNKQKLQAAGAAGRQDTILTSPIGLVDQPSGARKTILGQ